MGSSFFEGGFYIYFIIPFLIFMSRVLDVTLGTIRIVMISKGQRLLAPLLGFFEILIWLLAISSIFKNLDNFVCYIAYASGFALGNYVGLIIEEKLAVGTVRVQIITRKDGTQLIQNLIAAGYRLTYLDAKGCFGDVSIVYSIIKRTGIKKLERLVMETNPKAFYTVEDVKFVNQTDKDVSKFRFWRKGK